ncbi:MAG TPA: hypothetical protein VNM92_14230 [Thermoanaerobaculia bacterium]|nr:hypothetical protein [Thermoanaerobaculia bacterium]
MKDDKFDQNAQVLLDLYPKLIAARSELKFNDTASTPRQSLYADSAITGVLQRLHQIASDPDSYKHLMESYGDNFRAFAENLVDDCIWFINNQVGGKDVPPQGASRQRPSRPESSS